MIEHNYKLIKKNKSKIKNHQYRLRDIDRYVSSLKNTIYYGIFLTMGWYAFKIIL